MKGKGCSAFCAAFITPKTSTTNRTLSSQHHPPTTSTAQRTRGSGHTSTVICELERRNSSLANKYKVAHEVADKVTYNAFLSSYWLGKEEVANEKFLSLIELEKHVGVTEM